METPELLDLGTLKEFRFQRIDNTISIGAVAGSYGGNVTLDRAFNRIVGIGYSRITDGGLGNVYNVGAKTDRQTWIDPINIQMWDANAGVPLMGKYYKMNIPYASGDVFYTLITTFAAVNTVDLTGQMVLILVRDNIELAR